jgi:molecular chaperone DnaJ
MSDLYEILGIDRNADDETIKKAFKKLAIQFHPDKNKASNAEEKFKEVQNAYSILSDPEKRQRYDQFGLEGINNSIPNDFPFNDIFSSVFNGGNPFGGNPFGGNPFGGNPFGGMPFENVQRKQKKDIHLKFGLTLEEIYTGCKKNIKINYLKSCIKCDGAGGSKRKCDECKGLGRITSIKKIGPMMISNQTECNKCKGIGEIILIKCSDCNGKCNLEVIKEIIVEFPSGIKPEHIIMKEKGGHEIKDVHSDLKISIEEIPHEIYKRDNNDIRCKIHISLLDALVGYEKIFKLLDGSTIKYETKEITKPKTKLYLRNNGIIDLNTKKKGDLICNIIIDFPNKIEDIWIEELIVSRNKKTNTNNFETIID